MHGHYCIGLCVHAPTRNLDQATSPAPNITNLQRNGDTVVLAYKVPFRIMMEDMELDVKHQSIGKNKIIEILKDLADKVALDLNSCDSDDIREISNYANNARIYLQENKDRWTKEYFDDRAIEYIKELGTRFERLDPSEFVCEVEVTSPLNSQGMSCQSCIIRCF